MFSNRILQSLSLCLTLSFTTSCSISGSPSYEALRKQSEDSSNQLRVYAEEGRIFRKNGDGEPDEICILIPAAVDSTPANPSVLESWANEGHGRTSFPIRFADLGIESQVLEEQFNKLVRVDIVEQWGFDWRETETTMDDRGRYFTFPVRATLSRGTELPEKVGGGFLPEDYIYPMISCERQDVKPHNFVPRGGITTSGSRCRC